ncbi:MAG: hypothetical protein JW762_08120 [Dehalococcoidales bacterium]|nr:hypothetical protein [Dehalococcoidales bacterium]
MKKIHKISIITVIVIALAVVGLLPSGVAFADQTSHTVKFHFSSLNQNNYPLKDGFVLSIHMNGPVYFEKKVFQLRGAKPDTEFFIYRVFGIDLFIPGTGLVPAGTPLPAGDSFWTDKDGNGHIITSMPPDAPMLQLAKSYGIDHLPISNLLSDGRLEEGGVPAYMSEEHIIYLDFKWTP